MACRCNPDTECGQTKIKVPVLTWCNQHIFGAFK